MEVINLSFSQISNHVITHLYNNQESHIPYTKNTPLKYHNNVFLNLEKVHSNVNYSPRALLFDVRNGNGSLNMHEYFENNQVGDQSFFDGKKPRLKNQYQLNLDQGIVTNNRDLLNTANTQFWSDYNKLIYNPRSLTTLDNFEYPNNHKYFQNLKFNQFQIGEEEFIQSNYDVNQFRYFLEKCDHFQGLQLIVDVDSAWPGFSHLTIQQIIDEFFNDGNKLNLWVYGLMNDNNENNIISRIKSVIELSKHASLFFPFLPNYNSNLLNLKFDSNSPWQTSSISALYINGLWDTINQLNPTSMSTIENNLLHGSNRLFVNEIKISGTSHQNVQMTDIDINNYLNNDSLNDATQSSDEIYLTQNTSGSYYFSQNYIVPVNHEIDLPNQGVVNTYKTSNIDDITKVDSFPSILTNTDLYFQFHVTSQYKDTLKQYRKIIKNIRLNNDQHMKIVEDKHELIEDISNIIENYTNGYDESDEEGDDLW